MKSYADRFADVMTYIDENIERDITLKQLSDVACFSPAHFHRLFSAYLGMSVIAFIQRKKLKKAAMLLAYKVDMRVEDIAFTCGYRSSEAFSKAFKPLKPPKSYRDSPTW